MSRKHEWIILSCISLASCQFGSAPQYTYDTAYNYAETVTLPGYVVNASAYPDEMPYIQPIERRTVTVPESYHVGPDQSPVSHTDSDRLWVHQQAAGTYTIVISEDTKAAAVASRLHRVPKKERSAQVTYTSGGTTHYRGLYGSYNSYQAAEAALQALPPDMKTGAKVIPFSEVQN